MAPLSTYEIRVLRVCGDMPGGVNESILVGRTGYSAREIELSLSILKHDGLVDGTRAATTTWWRITLAGRDRLLRYPRPRLRVAKRDPAQLEIGEALQLGGIGR